MKGFKKTILLIISFVLLLVFLMRFDSSLLNVEEIGLEYTKAKIKVYYSSPLYTCKLNEQKDMYDIHDELNITCTNNILPNMEYKVKHEIFGEMYEQHTIDTLGDCSFADRWSSALDKKVMAVFRKIDLNKVKSGASFYFVIEDEDGYKAYREDYIFLNKNNRSIVRIFNGIVHNSVELVEIGKVERHEFAEYMKSLGYELFMQNYVYGIKCER